jgi:hypothetical protein
MWLTLLGVSAVAVVGRAAPARACSPPCETSVAVPRVSSMPGNLVSFRVTLDNPETLSLATAGGDAIPSHIVTRAGDRLFEPVEPLGAGGGLVLTYTMCPGAGAELREFAFTTDEASTVELRPSRLEVVERGVLYPDLGDLAVAFVRLRYTSPDARGNAGHLFEHRATVDGQPTVVTNTDGVLGVEIPTVCNQYTEDFARGMCEHLYSVPPGRHVVEVQSHILGEGEDPEPVQLAVETRCPRDVEREADSATSALEDAAASGELSSAGIDPSEVLQGVGEADVADLGGESTSSGTRASGCAFRQSNMTGGTGVLGLLLVLARRRRSPR